jgi:hypothetical protein
MCISLNTTKRACRYSENRASAVREPFTVFPLDIRSSEVKSLDDALSLFLQSEKVNMQDNKNASKYVSFVHMYICMLIHTCTQHARNNAYKYVSFEHIHMYVDAYIRVIYNKECIQVRICFTCTYT